MCVRVLVVVVSENRVCYLVNLWLYELARTSLPECLPELLKL